MSKRKETKAAASLLPVLYQVAGSDETRAMVAATKARHTQFCEESGYEQIVDTPTLLTDPWHKFRRIREFVGMGRDVLYVDADAVIADLKECRIDAAVQYQSYAFSIHPWPSNRNAFHYQVGVSAWRANVPSANFLDAVIGMEGDPETCALWGVSEQGAVNYLLLNERRWQRECALLPTDWNVNVHNQNASRAIIGAFHGADNRVRRIEAYLRELEGRDAGLTGDLSGLSMMDAITELRAAHDASVGGRTAEAAYRYERLIRLDPDNLEARRHFARMLERTGRLDLCIEQMQYVCAKEPMRASNAMILSNAMGAAGDKLRSRAWIEHAVARDPDNAYHQWCAAIAHLGWRQWERGWTEAARGYAYRVPRSRHWRPQWEGQALESGKTLYVAAEQGHGDPVFFSRWLPYAAKLRCFGVSIVLEVHEATVPLFAGFVEAGIVDQIVVFDAQNFGFGAPFDEWVSIGNLPYATKEWFVPPQVAVANAFALCTRGHAAPEDAGRFKIGVIWRGSPAHPEDSRRSFDWSILESCLGDLPGRSDVRIDSLQYVGHLKEGQQCPDERVNQRNTSTTDRLCAAILEQDFIVCCDTLVTNLAGSMGVPGAVLVTTAPDWRWQFTGDRSEWYPSVKVCRQGKPGDWDAAVADANIAVKTAFGRWIVRSPDQE